MYDGSPEKMQIAGCEAKETMTGKLQRERENLLKRLKQLDEALDLLHQNPDIQKVIDVLSKITHF